MLGGRKYRYRSLPCDIQPDSKLWCITGVDTITSGAGVLEWCYDEQDAHRIKQQMERSGEFTRLSAWAWNTRRLSVHERVIYRPAGLLSRYDGAKVEIVAINRHGHVTIKFLDGPRMNQTRGVKMHEVSRQ